MGFFAKFRAGRAMTKMVNVFEEVERNRKTREEGYGSHLPEARQLQVEQELRNSMEFLRQFPRHIVTENLLKNIRIAAKFNDNGRIQAYSTVLEILVEEGIALDLDTFEKSFIR